MSFRGLRLVSMVCLLVTVPVACDLSEQETPPASAGETSGAPRGGGSEGTSGAQDCGADLSSDPMNCGACGHDCLGGACSNGLCQPLTLATIDEPSITLDSVDIVATMKDVYWVASTTGHFKFVSGDSYPVVYGYRSAIEPGRDTSLQQLTPIDPERDAIPSGRWVELSLTERGPALITRSCCAIQRYPMYILDQGSNRFRSITSIGGTRAPGSPYFDERGRGLYFAYDEFLMFQSFEAPALEPEVYLELSSPEADPRVFGITADESWVYATVGNRIVRIAKTANTAADRKEELVTLLPYLGRVLPANLVGEGTDLFLSRGENRLGYVHLFRAPKAGGEAVELFSTGEREAIVGFVADEGFVYVAVADDYAPSEPEYERRTGRVVRVPRSGGEPHVLADDACPSRLAANANAIFYVDRKRRELRRIAK